LRVKRYWDNANNTYVWNQEAEDFKILGYRYLVPNALENPIFNPANATTVEETTGWFLILENKPSGFYDYSAVLNSTDRWANADIQIYRPSAPTEEPSVFYGIGALHDIGDAGLSTRYHKGGVRDQNETVTKTITSVFSSSASNTTFLTLSDSDPAVRPKIVTGDLIEFTAGSAPPLGNFRVNAVIYNPSTSRWVLYVNNLSITTGQVTALALAQLGAATLLQGDHYLRYREMGATKIVSGASVLFAPIVESGYLNDFFRTNYWNKGVPNAYVENAGQERRYATLMGSQPFFTDTFINGYSDFNVGALPPYDLDTSYGSIQALATDGDRIIIFKENKVTYVLVDKSVITTGDGSSFVGLSSNVLSTETPYQGDYGVSENPESIATFDGRYYFVDIRRGKVLRLYTNGITEISEQGVSSSIDAAAKALLSLSSIVKIFGGFDREYEEYILSIEDIPSARLTVDDGLTVAVGDDTFSFIDDDANEIRIIMQPEVGDSKSAGAGGAARTTGNEPRDWQDIPETWDEWGQVAALGQDMAQTSKLYFESPTDMIASGNKDVSVVINTTDGQKVLNGTYSFKDQEIVIAKTQTTQGTTAGLTSATVYTGFTLAYNETINKWISFRSYRPEMFCNVNYEAFTFKDGQMWRHNVGTTYANYYGVQYQPYFDISINKSPSTVKMFMSTSIEGFSPWDMTITTNLNATTVPYTLFEKKEGFWYSDVRFSTSGTTDGDIIPLGTITAIVGNVVTIAGANLFQVGLFTGMSVYEGSALRGTVSSFTTNTVTLSSVSGLAVNDFIFCRAAGGLSGDRVRGYYAQVRLTAPVAYAGTQNEVYAVNMEIERSANSHDDVV